MQDVVAGVKEAWIGKSQTPPDLVVKFQPIDMVDIILWLVLDRALSINGKSRAELPST